MYKLDSNDRLIGVLRTCFANKGVGAAAYCTGDEAEGKVSGKVLSLYLIVLVSGRRSRVHYEYLRRHHHLSGRYSVCCNFVVLLTKS